ncbi:TerC family protein [Siculibacillus lacustris]|uniref:TerC family protein n=1 Tax=Siculibacillus lacustris TaxID=1549641 RepID=A0A4Q9VQF4_9HYPH|nr:TerC family protein [Siculibacillus lacustris]
MVALLADPAAWLSLVTLTALEIVLGIDNVVFLSVATGHLPAVEAARARRLGLALALGFRIALLFAISWIVSLKDPVVSPFGHPVSVKDLILIGGGLFLIWKAVGHIHEEVEEPVLATARRAAPSAFAAVVGQIVVIDIVFSLDSIITAVGLAQEVAVMITAVILAVGVMYVAAGPVSGFIARHPTTKILALAFLLLIGVALVADGVGFHLERGYIYAAMAFAAAVEGLNILAKARREADRRPD